MKWLRWLERLAWGAGIALLVIWAAAKIHSAVGSRRDLQRFSEARRAPTSRPALPVETPSPARVLTSEAPPDESLWSKQRIEGYQASLSEKTSDPLAILRIPKIGLEVAVLEGTDDLVLNRAVGHIEDTPKPGENGNVGIAGHRDGFFRGLKDVVAGDQMQLIVADRTDTYVIDHIQIVSPDDVSVLEATPTSSLTLVTCYPFYFIGSAPQRYIVHASLLGLINNAKTAGHE